VVSVVTYLLEAGRLSCTEIRQTGFKHLPEMNAVHISLSSQNDEWWQTQQTSPRTPLQGAAPWWIKWHDSRAIACLLWKFHYDICNRFQ